MIRELRPKYPRLPVIRMCQLLGVARSLVYRRETDRPERAQFFKELILEIADIASLNPGYGYRRVKRELCKGGMNCGYKLAARAMREGGFQVRRKRRTARTSDGQGQGIHPNLLREIQIQEPGQVWVADITYIGLPYGFAYLACIFDVFLRKVVGQAMSKGLTADLPLEALKSALSTCKPLPGWIHHSDRGSQYLSERYIRTVLDAGGRISCSSKASPQDNAFMESFFKTLKAEEVWLEQYEGFRHAESSIHRYIRYYNADRMHSSLGYMSPEEFELKLNEHDPS